MLSYSHESIMVHVPWVVRYTFQPPRVPTTWVRGNSCHLITVYVRWVLGYLLEITHNIQNKYWEVGVSLLQSMPSECWLLSCLHHSTCTAMLSYHCSLSHDCFWDTVISLPHYMHNQLCVTVMSQPQNINCETEIHMWVTHSTCSMSAELQP